MAGVRGGRNTGTFVSLWFKNSGEGSPYLDNCLISAFFCLCYHRGLHQDLACGCGGEKMRKMAFYLCRLPSRFCGEGGAQEPPRPAHGGKGRQERWGCSPLGAQEGALAVTGRVANTHLGVPSHFSFSLSQQQPFYTHSLRKAQYFLLSVGPNCPNLFSRFPFWPVWNQMIAEPNPLYWNQFKAMSRP